MHKALFYEKLEDKKVICRLCNHFCVITNNSAGICSVRINKEGTLYTLVYGKIVADNIDPIEKKPFFHFLPGSFSYSISTVGCNFQCGFCQNYEMAQAPRMGIFPDVPDVGPEQVIKKALQYNCQSISYTYTEPTIFFEFVYDCCKIAKQQGLKNNFVTNGFISPDALEMIAPYLDAANVDVKGNEDFYTSVCKARFEPVLQNIRRMKKLGIWVEITTLLIPEYNDNNKTFDMLSKKFFDIDPEMPWHFSRFFPAYKFSNHYPTPEQTVYKYRENALKMGFKYVYAGNISEEGQTESTKCPQCSKLLIKRSGFSVLENNIKKDICPDCGRKISGVF
ncbi:AmmeMemoRadiSam system radical SAM enzyme [bacterium Unc6]|nr:AmmeMemoRadiSam system radical SAM enzyme [bacterium Unc6]